MRAWSGTFILCDKEEATANNVLGNASQIPTGLHFLWPAIQLV